MNRPKKIALWVAGSAGVLLVLLGASAFLLPKLVHLDSLKEMILTNISGATGCQTGCRNIDILFFPRPRVVVHDVDLSVSGKFSGKIGSVTAYPRIMPLFLGKVQLGRLFLDKPEMQVVLPQTHHGQMKEGQQEPLSPEDLEQRLTSLLTSLVSKVPWLFVRIDNGSLEVSEENGEVFRFQNLNARVQLSPTRLKVDLGCGSNLWERITLSTWLDVGNLSCGGHIILTDFKPGLLTRYLFPAVSQTIGESQLSLDVTFTGQGPRDLQAEFHGSIPSLDLQGGEQDFIIRCEALDGAFHVNTDRVEVTVSRLKLDYPELSLKGKFLVDSSIPSASLEVESRDTDADAVRRIALAVGGEHRTVQKIFDVIRGGRVPLITYSASASTPAKFGKAQHFVIKGSMVDGKIFVPKVQLDVEDASGEVIIANGILDGKNLEGRTANSRGREGSLKIALMRKEGVDPPFHLDIDIDADLVELKPVLERVVNNEPFLREMALIKDVKGRAQGRLVLGESLTDVKTRVDVREFHLSSRYQRLPHSVDLKGGPFLYEATHVAVGPASGRMGKSMFSGASARVDWGEQSELDITTSSPATILLDEIFPWLISHEQAKKALKGIESARGSLTVDNLQLKGPLFRWRERQLKTKGSVADLVLDVPALPTPLTVRTGRFDAIHDRLTLEGLQSAFSDASLVVAGSLQNYLEGVETANLTLQGTVGPQAGQWVFDLIHLPAEFRPRSPLSLSQSHLVREKDGRLSFAGEIAPRNGPRVSIDVRRTPEEISISRLAIKDDNSDADLSIGIKNRELDLGFKGTLSKTSLDRLLAKNQILTGWVKGNFRSHIFLDRLMGSTASGELQTAGFQYSWKPLKGPIFIENASLAANGSKLDVKSAFLNWQDSHMSLKGRLDFSVTGLVMDMDLTADKLDWEQLKQGEEKGTGGRESAGKENKVQEKEGKDSLPEKNSKLWNENLQGVLRISTESFTYGKLTWTPLKAGATFRRNAIDIDLTEANLCGISTPGSIKISPQGTLLSFKPSAVNQEADPVVTCLLRKKELINGTFNLTGELTTGQDSQDGPAKSLKGTLDLNARKGRIYRLGVLSKIFAVLNVTEIYRGHLPDLINEGFAYNSIKARGSLHNGKLTLSDSVIDGPTMKMVWHGDVDLTQKKVDFTVLIAPLRTVDKIIGHVPLLGDFLGGNLISIPVKVSGDLDDPDVVPLSPSAVGAELFGYLKRTFQLPLTLIEPLL